jgi:hypothetical protein
MAEKLTPKRVKEKMRKTKGSMTVDKNLRDINAARVKNGYEPLVFGGNPEHKLFHVKPQGKQARRIIKRVREEIKKINLVRAPNAIPPLTEDEIYKRIKDALNAAGIK